MTRITQDQELEFSTVADAQRYVRNLKGRVRFTVFVRCFFPTDQQMGFEGSTCIGISRKEFIKVLKDTGSTLVYKRGGRIQLRVKAADPEFFSSLASVTLW